MVICLTGDIHHSTMDAKEHSYCQETELELALKYIDIAKNHGIANITLFVTGKTFETGSPSNILELLDYSSIEIGGHTYSAFRPTWLHVSFKHLWGTTYGPYWYQECDIDKTIKIIQHHTKNHIRSWRTHAYASNTDTYDILTKHGISVVSDMKSLRYLPRYFPLQHDQRPDMLNLIINTPPDHDHIIHGPVVSSDIDESNYADDCFGYLYDKEEWLDMMKERIRYIENNNGVSTILCHPLCMKILDNFKTFKKLCSFLSDYDNILASNVAGFLDER